MPSSATKAARQGRDLVGESFEETERNVSRAYVRIVIEKS
jgi:hypothetical protein